MMTSNYAVNAEELLLKLGVQRLSKGLWAFTDVETASNACIHHSSTPTALAAYASVDPKFALGRFPSLTLVDLVDKVPCMDLTELTALAVVCGAPAPSFVSSSERARIFGEAVWSAVGTYSLEDCFERVGCAYGDEGSHYYLRPRGLDWAGDQRALPDVLKTVRKGYRSMTPLQQVFVLTIMHLHCQGKDKIFLIGGCPTKILAGDALNVLRDDGNALSAWGYIISHYAGW